MIYLESTTEFLIAFEYLQAVIQAQFPKLLSKLRLSKHLLFAGIVAIVASCSIVLGHHFVTDIVSYNQIISNYITDGYLEFKPIVHYSFVILFVVNCFSFIVVFSVLFMALCLIHKLIRQREERANNFLICVHLVMTLVAYGSLGSMLYNFIRLTKHNDCLIMLDFL